MRLRHLVIPFALAAGCAPTSGPSTVADAPDPQAQDLASLEAETGARWSVRYHADIHTPAFLEGRTAPLAATRALTRKAAESFLTQHRALFRMAGDPVNELTAAHPITDELGMTHVHFTQRQGSVTVEGGELTAHFDETGALVRINGRYIPLPSLALVPVVTQDDAMNRALASAQATRSAASVDSFQAARPLLRIDPSPSSSPSPSPRLAWLVDVAVEDPAAPGRLMVWIDGATGESYRTDEALTDLAGSGKDFFGNTLPLAIAEKKGHYFLENANGGKPPQKTYSAAGKTKLPGKEVRSDRPDEWDTDGDAPGSAVDAHAYVTIAIDYYARVHGRAGAFDNSKGIRASVHFGKRYDNAFWNGRQLVFGDGDGQDYASLAAGLDVVAHEFTHAVTEHAAHLGYADESGALNEGLSDIFACFIEHDARGATAANWTIGEDVDRQGTRRGMRDLADPHRLAGPAHVDEKVITTDDRGGVHINSTIPSHAAFLMTEGGTNAVSGIQVPGIGLVDAEKLWYRALTRYLGQKSSFADAADATLSAATDLWGATSANVASVRQAWLAVGVLQP